MLMQQLPVVEMLINKMIKCAESHNLNIYRIAFADKSGIREKTLHPANACTNSYSVAKAFTVTAIGMLCDQNKLRVSDMVYDLFQSDFPKKFDSRWKSVTIEHLLTHKVGFMRGFLDIDKETISKYASNDFLQIVLSKPLIFTPGKHYQYSDAASYLLSRIVTKISGENLDDFLRPTLFDKLGFQEMAWSCCPFGYPMGATGLYIRTSDMVKLGYVYANNGTYHGQRVISENWVQQVLSQGYEFHPCNDNGWYAKGGMYGQMLCFSTHKQEAYAWHAYESKNNVKVLLRLL